MGPKVLYLGRGNTLSKRLRKTEEGLLRVFFPLAASSDMFVLIISLSLFSIRLFYLTLCLIIGERVLGIGVCGGWLRHHLSPPHLIFITNIFWEAKYIMMMMVVVPSLRA